MRRTKVLRADKKNIKYAAAELRKGALVAFPTETVYGLGANILNKRAVARLYRVKRRPRTKPFTILIPDRSAIRKAGCQVTECAKRLMDEFWPGPLTMILEGRRGEKIGFRMPDNKIALSLVKYSGVPVAAPSANVSGSRAPTTAEEVLDGLDGKIDLVLDGGAAAIGVESTVVDLTAPRLRILREGAIKKEEVLRVIENE